MAANAALWRLTARNADIIVPLGGQGGGCPFYCVHSISGEVNSFHCLAKEVGQDRRIYGFQVPAHRMTSEFGNSVESIAEHYVELLLAREPRTKFFLSGWSAGSFIALEMAQILRRRGRETPLLIALDGFQFKTRVASEQPNYLSNLLRNVPHWLEDTLATDRKRGLIQRVQKRMRRAIALSPSSKRTSERLSTVERLLETSAWPEAQTAFVRSLFDIVEKYEAKPYHGPLLVFAAKAQHFFRAGQVEFTWKRISKSAEVIRTDGSHVTMLQEPRVANLAKSLRERLAAFDQRVQHAELPPTLENAAGAGIQT